MTIEEGSSSSMATTATTAVIEDETSQTLFGKYEVGRLLGCGAFAKVYHARDKRSGQSVAIKVVSKQKVFKGNLTGHVKREISIMSRLRHPHIVRLHEVLATKTKICFVMEFAKGGELFAKISKGRFSEDLSRKYFQQLISAVGYCHTHGIFHRDLKPENLLLDENWDLKVSDFGLSALTEQIRPDGLLHTLCGTPAYVAPEILAKKGYNGPQVDVWSCGIILFVLNAGYLPFNDPNLMVMYRKIYKGEFRCPRWTSPELKRLLTRLLDINPETRITIDEIHKDVWFQKGYKEIKPYFDHEFDYFKIGGDEGEVSKKYMNAFDIICSGLDISNLFRYKTNESAVVGERFLSAEAPEKIADTIEEVAKKEGVSVMKKKQGGTTRLRLEGQNGNFCGVVEINQLTEKLVMVEVRKKEAGGFWKDKFRPQLDCLIYRPDEQVAGE